jgi:hypothetical protein
MRSFTIKLPISAYALVVAAFATFMILFFQAGRPPRRPGDEDTAVTIASVFRQHRAAHGSLLAASR